MSILFSRKGESAPADPDRIGHDWRRWLASAILLLAGVAVYANSFAAPFLFDDLDSIVSNPSIRSWRTALFPPQDLTVSGRPLLNLMLALNHAVHGLDVRGFHAVNLAFHLAAALVLFGLVRRLSAAHLSSCRRDPVEAHWLAFAVAMLWLVHPLQTSAVTYIVQRAEVLVSLFYLLTLYCFVRSIDTGDPWRWQAASVAACAAGMATKEVMVSAPLIVLLYDRVFVSEGFGAIWRSRGRYHLALASTWLLLAWLMVGTSGRAGTAGFGMETSAWTYALTQCHAVLHYLRLAFWPDALAFDYGPNVLVTDAMAVLPHALVLMLLAGGTLYALWRRSLVGFVGVVFFAVLAPTSSVVPLADPMFEHRMYLPLAAVVALAVFGASTLLRRRPKWTGFMLAGIAGALAITTVLRNADFRSSERIWRDTVEKRPDNPRAWASLGRVLLDEARTSEAAACLRRSVALAPRHAGVRHLLANTEMQLGQGAGAIEQFEAAIRLDPENARLRNDAGNAWLQLGQIDRAVTEISAATRLDPSLPEAHYNLGNAIRIAGRPAEAMEAYRAALRLAPEFVEPRFNLGNALVSFGRLEEAAAEFRVVTKLRPELAVAWTALGNVFAQLGRQEEAREAYLSALRLAPGERGAESGLRKLEPVPPDPGSR